MNKKFVVVSWLVLLVVIGVLGYNLYQERQYNKIIFRHYMEAENDLQGVLLRRLSQTEGEMRQYEKVFSVYWAERSARQGVSIPNPLGDTMQAE